MSKLECGKLMNADEAKNVFKHMLSQGKTFLCGPKGAVEVPNGTTPDEALKMINEGCADPIVQPTIAERINNREELTEEQKQAIEDMIGQKEKFQSTIDNGLLVYQDEFDTMGTSSAPYFIRDDNNEMKMPEIRINEQEQVTNFEATVATPIRIAALNMAGANNFLSGLTKEGDILVPINKNHNSIVLNTRLIMTNFQNSAITILNSMCSTIMQTFKDMLTNIYVVKNTPNLEYTFSPNYSFDFERGGIRQLIVNLRNYVDSKEWEWFSEKASCESIVNNNTINQISALYTSNVVNFVVNTKFRINPEDFGAYDEFINAVAHGYINDIQSFVLETFHEIARLAMVHISMISSINGEIPRSNPLLSINNTIEVNKDSKNLYYDCDFEY